MHSLPGPCPAHSDSVGYLPHVAQKTSGGKFGKVRPPRARGEASSPAPGPSEAQAARGALLLKGVGPAAEGRGSCHSHALRGRSGAPGEGGGRPSAGRQGPADRGLATTAGHREPCPGKSSSQSSMDELCEGECSFPTPRLPEGPEGALGRGFSTFLLPSPSPGRLLGCVGRSAGGRTPGTGAGLGLGS